jgi:hypothetical protein
MPTGVCTRLENRRARRIRLRPLAHQLVHGLAVEEDDLGLIGTYERVRRNGADKTAMTTHRDDLSLFDLGRAEETAIGLAVCEFNRNPVVVEMAACHEAAILGQIFRGVRSRSVAGASR